MRSDRKVPVGPVLTPLAALLILALCSGGTFGSSESDVPTSFAVRIDYNHEFRGSCEPVTVTVQFQSEVMGGESPFRYVWDFGDGGTSSDSSPAHTYTSILVEYTITLVVTDANGSVASGSLALRPPPPPCAARADAVLVGGALVSATLGIIALLIVTIRRLRSRERRR